jgi:hypothetical protein
MKAIRLTALVSVVAIGCSAVTAHQRINVRPPGMRIQSIQPGVVAPGEKIEIAGYGFGSRGGKFVLLIQGEGNDARYTVLVTGSWSNQKIDALIPGAINHGDYRVGICGDNLLEPPENPRLCRVRSNTVPLDVVRKERKE